MPLYGTIVVIKRTGVDGSQFPLTAKECLFGSGDNCDVRIRLPSVAAVHCEIKITDTKEIFITNLDSDDPTTVNGKQLTTGQPTKLNGGDIFMVADRSFRFENAPRPRRVSARKSKTTAEVATENMGDVDGGTDTISDAADMQHKDPGKTPKRKPETPRLVPSERKNSAGITPKRNDGTPRLWNSQRKENQNSAKKTIPAPTRIPRFSFNAAPKSTVKGKVYASKTPIAVQSLKSAPTSAVKSTPKNTPRSVAVQKSVVKSTPKQTPTTLTARSVAKPPLSSKKRLFTPKQSSKIELENQSAKKAPTPISNPEPKEDIPAELPLELGDNAGQVASPKSLRSEPTEQFIEGPTMIEPLAHESVQETSAVEPATQEFVPETPLIEPSVTEPQIDLANDNDKTNCDVETMEIDQLDSATIDGTFQFPLDRTGDYSDPAIVESSILTAHDQSIQAGPRPDTEHQSMSSQTKQSSPTFSGEKVLQKTKLATQTPRFAGTKRLFTQRKSIHSPKLMGVAELLREDKARSSPRLVGLPALFEESKGQATPKLNGVAQLLRENKQQESPNVSGLSELFSEEKTAGSPKLEGVSKRFSEKKGQKSPRLGGISKLFRQAKVQGSPKVGGIRKIFKQDRNQSSPRLDGVPELFKTTKSKPSPRLSGIRRLMKEPKALVGSSPNFDGLSTLFKEARPRTSRQRTTPPPKAQANEEVLTTVRSLRSRQAGTSGMAKDAAEANCSFVMAGNTSKPKRGRKAAVVQQPIQMGEFSVPADEKPKRGRKRVATAKEEVNSSVNTKSPTKDAPVSKRGRKPADEIAAATHDLEAGRPKRGRKVSPPPQAQENEESSTAGRFLRIRPANTDGIMAEDTATKPKRGRKAAEVQQPTDMEVMVVLTDVMGEVKPKRGRKRAATKQEEVGLVKSGTPTKDAPIPKRGRKPADDIAVATHGAVSGRQKRGQKAVPPPQTEANEEVVPVGRSLRSRRGDNGGVVDEAPATKPIRGKKVAEAVSSGIVAEDTAPKPKRGRKAAEVQPVEIEDLSVPADIADVEPRRGRSRVATKGKK